MKAEQGGQMVVHFRPNLVLPDFNLDSPLSSDYCYSGSDDDLDTVIVVTVEETVEVIPLGHPDNLPDTAAKLLVFSSLA